MAEDMSGATLCAGTLPHEWSSMSRIASISLVGNGSMMGSMPSAWGWMPHLQQLSLTNMAFDDSEWGSCEYAHAPSVQPPSWRCIPAIQLFKPCLARIMDHENSYLILSPIAVLPHGWSSASLLKSLSLRRLSLKAGATLPTSWGNLTALQELTVDSLTGLSGGLPSQWQQGELEGHASL